MANPEHVKILKQGVEQWNKWRGEHLDVAPDLIGAELGDADLIEAYLGEANLSGANLRDADLSHADLGAADLSRTDLSRAKLGWAGLTGANLSTANLSRANLSGANLGWADLRGANLGGANFSEARARATIFADVDLSVAKGLETVRHEGPSTIGIDTIYKSHGKIPEAFLRGCGVPDEFIAYIGSMVGRPLEFYSCFISYSTRDQEFAERLHADLQAKGVRCWFAPEEMKAGRKLHEQIDEAIRLHDKLLLILSEHSMSSNWVKTEIANAREREKREGKQLLFPITLVPFEAIKQWKLFDADIGMDSAREIREYFIPDFSNWRDHDSYQAAFQRLVKDLKAGAGG
ncbi:MAG TPA: toll/interleukin-1 receptor domain-containing protein [Terriglobales bacterium]